MAFVLGSKIDSVLRTISITMPADVGKKPKKEPLKVRIKLPSREEQKAWRERIVPPQPNEDGEIDPIKLEEWESLEAIDYLDDFILDIPEGIVDEDGKPVEYSREVLQELCKYEHTVSPLQDLCFEFIYGKEIVKRVKSKNS